MADRFVIPECPHCGGGPVELGDVTPALTGGARPGAVDVAGRCPDCERRIELSADRPDEEER